MAVSHETTVVTNIAKFPALRKNKPRGLRRKNYALVVPVVMTVMVMIVGMISVVMPVMVVAIVMVIPVMIMAVPSCRWGCAADCNCADNT